MKTKKHFGLYIFLTFLISIIYISLAAKPLTTEHTFSPVWKINTSNPVIKQSSDNKKLKHFHLGQTLGYFDENGNISLYETFPDKVSISDSYYAIYNSSAKDTVFYKNNGQEAGIIEASGFPYFCGNMIYVFLPGGCSFSKCSESGKVLWTFESIFPITAFTAKEKYTAVGLSNGSIKILNNETGSTEIDFSPGGSELPVILGLDISDDGMYVASVSGHNHQRFVISKREEKQQKIIYHRFFDYDSPYRTAVHFCNDGKRVFYNFYGGIGIYDISEKTEKIIPMKDKILSIDETDDFVILLGKEKASYTLSIIDSTNTLEGSFSFKAETAFVHADKQDIYLGKDNTISRFSVSKE